MLHSASGLKGCTLQAVDGPIGEVSDFLFDDRTWHLRWLVAETGSWLLGRKRLLHASAIGQFDPAERALRVDLTRAQVGNSPGLGEDQPVSRQHEGATAACYGWDPTWDTGLVAGGGIDAADSAATEPDQNDPHLRSVHAVTGYKVHAIDGPIGHVDDFLLDDRTWSIDHLLVETGAWWAGKDLLLAPGSIDEIDWHEREIRLSVTREAVRSSPAWVPADPIAPKPPTATNGWPGFGWREKPSP